MIRSARIAGLLAAGVLAVTVGLLEKTVTGRRVSRNLARALSRRARYETGRLEGFRYRLAGGQPDPAAHDRVLADRVRSVIGPLEHRLDVPRLHVQAQGHRVLLHGNVTSERQAEALIRAVTDVPGVHDVESHLHVGLFRGDTKPSEGASHVSKSAALTSVLAAAHAAGVPEGAERSASRGVLSAFAAVLPAGERRHVLAHLPADLRALAEPGRPRWFGGRHPRHVEDFALVALPTYAPALREPVVESILGALRDLVPEEVADVTAVLPVELRHLWKTAIPA